MLEFADVSVRIVFYVKIDYVIHFFATCVTEKFSVGACSTDYITTTTGWSEFNGTYITN